MHACPLRSLDVKNFKSIADSKVEFLPLTMLVGMNSSGKSSLLQAIRFLSQTANAIKPGTDVPLNGTNVRLGTFDDMRSVGTDGPVSLQVELVTAGHEGPDGDEAEPDALLILDVAEPDTRPDRGHAKISANRIEVPNAATLCLAEQWLRAIWSEYVEGFCDRYYAWLDENEPHWFLDLTNRLDEDDLLTHLKDLCGDERAHDLKTRSFVQAGIRDIQGAVAGIGAPTFEEFLEAELETASEIDRSDPRRHDLILRLIGINHPDDDFRKLAVQIEEALREELSSGRTVFEKMEDDTEPEGESDTSPFGFLVDRARRAFYGHQAAQLETETQASINAIALEQADVRRVVDQVRKRARWRHTEEEGYAIALSIAEAGGLRLDRAEDPDQPHGDPVTDFLKVARMFVEKCQDQPWLDDPVLTDYANRAMEGKWRPAVTTLLRERVGYLGPLRQEPRAFSDFSDEGRPDVGAAGEHLARVLQWHGTKAVAVPGLGQADLVDGLQHWLRELGIVEDVTVEARGRAGVSVEVRPPELDRPVDLTSVGVGVSQVLPVLAVCLLAEPGDIVLLEQPELHLHPALQMKLADFLLACVDSGRQLIVETHSEHLVNRLRRRVAEDDSSEVSDLVRVVFAERDADGHTSFRPSDINPLGGLSEDWPNGFLDLGARDAQKLLQAGLAKHRRLSDD